MRISQILGTSYTVISDVGYMCRIDASDADALGLTPGAAGKNSHGPFHERMVLGSAQDRLRPGDSRQHRRPGFDYSATIAPHDQGGRRIDVKMSMTAPGCGMGNVLKADVEHKLAQLPEAQGSERSGGVRSALAPWPDV